MRAAAVQLEAIPAALMARLLSWPFRPASPPAEVDANLAATERLVGEAAAAVATVIALPEFFTTGIGCAGASTWR
jgi:hypothetical protein